MALIRAVGPTLAAFGIRDALQHPVLSIYQGERLVATKRGWTGGTSAESRELLEAFDRVGAFRFVDGSSDDSAFLVELVPGPYTVQVKSGDGTPGVTLVEVYDLP
jgi:hypothetical protein